jgi:amidohydrolase
MRTKQSSLFPSPRSIHAAAEWSRGIRHQIHQHPETGFNETATATLVAKKLKDFGYQVTTGVAKTGVVGFLKGGKPGKTIGLRADMDALPMQEKTGLPYASKVPGVMHACGHDGHTAILLGAAKVIAEQRRDLAGNVKLFFQPAEEGGGGGFKMANAGFMKNPKVDVIYALHGWESIDCGVVGYTPGPCFASANLLKITVHGKGGHGAVPHRAIDPIYLSSLIIQALQSIVSRRLSALSQAIISICKISGGTTHNIIPDSVDMVGTIRTFDARVQKTIIREVKHICKHVAASHDGRVDCKITETFQATINDSDALEFAKEVAREALGAEQVREVPPTMGSEDFSCFLQHAPGAYLLLGLRKNKGTSHPVHSPHFDFNDDAIPAGIKLMSGLALRYLR